VILLSIWLAIASCIPAKSQDMVFTESIVSLYCRKDDKKRNAFSAARDC
jgi:hypothetical protein